MNNAAKVFAFLLKVAAAKATNSDIVARTGIRPHQQVFQITQRLLAEKRISGSRIGREWHFRAR
jgi:hypothetical protein